MHIFSNVFSNRQSINSIGFSLLRDVRTDYKQTFYNYSAFINFAFCVHMYYVLLDYFYLNSPFKLTCRSGMSYFTIIIVKILCQKMLV